MTSDQIFQAVAPGVPLFFANRGYDVTRRLLGNKLLVTILNRPFSPATKEFSLPADNQELTAQFKAWLDELEGVAE
tara:strand:+ start:613 stop:840 length:228 start_codon:yes stop_codon:yes gene_type:complete